MRFFKNPDPETVTDLLLNVIWALICCNVFLGIAVLVWGV